MQTIDMTKNDDGTVCIFINRDHWDNADNVEDAWRKVATHLAEVTKVTIRDFTGTKA